jgi:anti-sigma factor RsiW
MTSPDDRERLSAWLDGELSAVSSPEETREFLARLESDPALLREAEELRRVWDLLGRYPDEPVREGFADAVLARAREGSPVGDAVPAARTGWRVLAGGARSGRLAVAASVAVALGLGAFFAIRASSPSGESSPSTVLEALPAEAVENLSALASLSDAEFEAILSSDPDDLARLLEEARGG